MRKTVMTASVEACFPFYRSACALSAAYGDIVSLQRYEWQEFTPTEDGEMAGLYEAVSRIAAH